MSETTAVALIKSPLCQLYFDAKIFLIEFVKSEILYLGTLFQAQTSWKLFGPDEIKSNCEMPKEFHPYTLPRICCNGPKICSSV